MYYVKHDNFFSRQSYAKQLSVDLINDVIVDLNRALQASSPERRAEFCDRALLCLESSLRYQGYTTPGEKKADEAIEELRKKQEAVNDNA